MGYVLKDIQKLFNGELEGWGHLIGLGFSFISVLLFTSFVRNTLKEKK